jgi:hypothetical protein
MWTRRPPTPFDRDHVTVAASFDVKRSLASSAV